MKNRRKSSAMGPWALVLVALALVAFVIAVAKTAPTPAASAHAVVTRSAPTTAGRPPNKGNPLGVPAITPHIFAPAGSSAAAIAATASFNRGDVEAYYHSHSAGVTSARADGLTIESITFMTDAQAAAQLNSEPGLAPDAVVCVVVLKDNSGTFTAPTLGKNNQFTELVQVFAGSTGNSVLQQFVP